MKFKNFLPVLFIIFFVKHTTAQEIAPADSTTRPAREFTLSVFTGLSLLGPKSDMESTMAASGLGDTSPGGWFGGPKAHPFTDKYPIVDIEATYYVSKNSGLSLNTALIDNIEVFGYEDIGTGNFLFLKSETWSIALNYVYASKDKTHALFIGPAFFIHHVEDVSAGTKSPENLNKKLGFYAGYSLRLLQKKHWLLRFKTTYRAIPGSEIGPFIAQHELGIFTPDPEVYTSEFSPAKVNVSSINIGLSVGLRRRIN